jgi:hypothetical protein
MGNWQKSSTRAPHRTKAELSQMLAEAVRNTKPASDQGSKCPANPRKIAAATAHGD